MVSLGMIGAGESNSRARMEVQRADPQSADGEAIRTGWRFGAEDFLTRLLDRMEDARSEHHSSRERRESDLERAERIIAEKLAEAGWDAQRLRLERKGHPLKVEIAAEVRRQTTASLKWIAARLHIGT